jgi:hypothetical protein
MKWPGLQVVTAYGNGLRFSPELGILELGPWVQDKAGIEIMIPGVKKRLLLIIWARNNALTGLWEYNFSGLATMPEKIALKFSEVKFPKPCEEAQHIFYDQYRSVFASGKLGKVQGFDMFCLSLGGYQQARRFYRLGEHEVVFHSPRRFFAYIRDSLLRSGVAKSS